ncbi:M23 family metallopeptidase [Halodesulfovibrio sp.]|jgi:murein DD-endopeptidase MepM/ murein hydrolase activator NlpD|uniref:M23 family metallopeptidase n=1 Tax=Halodesulfovibrio sp. TaxID=1912772 RepID=UPI0025E7CA6E|nr:M23 family metallopeptidase [Halodesulfovibrio sp.]MCT4534896.1 M23 family metallopeptidase [Halodesulfovibrio sp.]MCT4627791.1 M23 family metallopeptidase [Halodesulfovibrio sp.]
MASLKKTFFFIIFLSFICSGAILGWLLFKDQQGPIIAVDKENARVNKNSTVTLSLHDVTSNLKNLSIAVRKNSKTIPLYATNFPQGKKSITLSVPLANAAVSDGSFEMLITATDTSLAAFGKGNTTRKIVVMRMDNTPPSITVKSLPPNIWQGGTGVIAYTISEPVNTSGVKVNDMFFPGYKQADGTYISFFAFPQSIDKKDFNPTAYAMDIAGNVYDQPFSINPLSRKFRHDKIRLSDRFLNSQMSAFAKDTPQATTNLERFLIVNRQIRKKNRDSLVKIGRQTSSSILWQGKFLRFPNSATRAGFGDRRSYMYNGEVIDQQTHLGLDLASRKQSPIPAANKGTVVFAGNLGIYGNVVIIDHGLGLQTLYAHMTEIRTTVGSVVNQGDILGISGSTGMSGGDHLHFGVIVSGIPVTPIEWFDHRWIQYNITDKLNFD